MSSKRKQKQVSLEEYVQTYCQERRMRNRIVLYVSRETHRRLKKVVLLFHDSLHTTTSSLAEAIISHHLEVHTELLNDTNRRFLEEDRREVIDEPDETDWESCPDDDSED